MKLLQKCAGVAALLLAGTTATIPGQTSPPDALATARTLVRNGHRSEALKVLEDRLAVAPSDSDARVLRGIILSWEGRYEESRQELTLVLAVHPGHGDAVTALLNVEMWSDHPERAELLARKELERHPADPALLLAQARALKAMHKVREAAGITHSLVHTDPANRQARELDQKLGEELQHWEAAFSHASDWFSDGTVPWREEQISLTNHTPAGSLIGRFSQTERFALDSQQMEVDFYPHIRSGTYAYLNAGYSPDAVLYPRYRVGADLYQTLGHGVEASAGYRRLAFGAGINIYTAALAKYQGSWLVSSRVYLTPDTIGTSHSMQFSVRRYLGGASNYWSLRGGWGSSPAEITSVADIGILDSSSFGGEFSFRLSRRLSLRGHAGVSYEDRVNRAGLYHYTADATLYCRF